MENDIPFCDSISLYTALSAHDFETARQIMSQGIELTPQFGYELERLRNVKAIAWYNRAIKIKRYKLKNELDKKNIQSD
jgi:hypothetical protein